jgi:hypothetical protein
LYHSEENQQEKEQTGVGRGEAAQTVYTYVSKCKTIKEQIKLQIKRSVMKNAKRMKRSEKQRVGEDQKEEREREPTKRRRGKPSRRTCVQGL